MTVPSEVQADLAGLQDALLKTDSLEQFMHELAVLAARTVSEGMSCGMALRPQGRPAPVTACSDPLASQAGQAQNQAGDGPVMEAMRQAWPVRSSIVSRAVIDQALGVIMATERCSQDKAFAMLRSVSQNTNVKLRDLAATIVTNVSGEPPRLTAPFEDG